MAIKMFHVRVDEKIKQQASAAFAMMVISMSEAVRVFLYRVAVEQAMPFTIKVRNGTTRAAMGEAEHLSNASSQHLLSCSMRSRPQKNNKKRANPP